jgi:transcriptional regulator with XRE-family HTH domain
MVIGNRLRELRESKQLSQGDIEKRTGLLRCYISRVENGHTVPAIETLEKMARALEVPMYRRFHAGEVPAGLSKMKPPKDDEFGTKGRAKPITSPNCAGYLRKWNLTTKSCCCTWPKKSGNTDLVRLTAFTQKRAGTSMSVPVGCAVLRHQFHSQQEDKQLAAVLAACRKDVLGEAGELPVAEFFARLRWFVA